MNAIKRPYYVTPSAYTGEDLSKTHTELSDYGWDLGYWVSTDATNFNTRLESTANPPRYISTKRFTRAELPMGTVIEIAPGYIYRPEAWLEDSAQTTRPDNVTTNRIVINEEWWGKYQYRAFNISTGGSETFDFEEGKAAFKIWLPK